MAETIQMAHWFVSGRVQGVGFRWFVVRRAKEYGVVGWAKNLNDGRVEVVGQGSSQALMSLESALRAGPRLSRVDNVEKADCPHEMTDIKSFDIR